MDATRAATVAAEAPLSSKKPQGELQPFQDKENIHCNTNTPVSDRRQNHRGGRDGRRLGTPQPLGPSNAVAPKALFEALSAR